MDASEGDTILRDMVQPWEIAGIRHKIPTYSEHRRFPNAAISIVQMKAA